ncbi:MAG: low temperature requirement protein A [Microbacteriaceae bacterium]|nr:low temperature requirement protein A [Microbacteriaceae bacterium]
MSTGPRICIPAPMTRRDIDKEHRVSRPLELLFDLIFVVAVAQIAAQLAHTIDASGHGVPGTIMLVALVTSASAATSIVANERRTARGPQ